jgi:hypothetical protein
LFSQIYCYNFKPTDGWHALNEAKGVADLVSDEKDNTILMHRKDASSTPFASLRACHPIAHRTIPG